MSTSAALLSGPVAMTPWRRHLGALGLAITAILLLFARDAVHMATIWWTSDTFNHCLLIVPIIGWLVWQRAPALGAVSPTTWPSAMLLVAAGAAAWLLGDAAGVSLARHFGLIVILQGTVAALLGRQAARLLFFPLFYALFLVPTGEEFVPALQGVTARISMALLHFVGVPAHLEGVFITTPGGYFEVAEACSGVKFLVAMFALGVLVAALCYRSWTRRLLFLAAAIVVPILANGVRAFATIYVAGKTSNEAAASFDHIFYGWFFFAIIIAALLGAAWRTFDRSPNESFRIPTPDTSTGHGASLPVMLVLTLSVAALPVIWAGTASARARDIALPALTAPAVFGWSKVERTDGIAWTPRFAGADRFVVQRYRDASGRQVDLAIAVYAWQAEGRELVGFGQGAVAAEGAWSWSRTAAPPPGGRADRIVAGRVMREVLSFYRVGDLVTGNDAAVKLATLKARLLGGRQASAAVLVSSEAASDPARATIDRFMAALGPVDALSARVTGG